MAGHDSFGVIAWSRLLATIAWLVIFVFWPQTTFATTLLIVGGVFIAFNAMIFWVTMVRMEEASSVAPIIGGIIAAGGVMLLPLSGSWKWVWIPLVIDWGGIPMLLAWYAKRFRA
jgi:hypothetical protein